MSDTAAIAITTVHSILVIVDILGNSLVCAIIKRNRDMRMPMNYLLVNLAVADILYGMVVTPRIFFKILFNNHLPDGMTGTVLCKLLADGTVAWIGSGSSFVTLVAVAIERYYAVMHPHDSRWKVTKYKLKVIILVSWVFGLVLDIPIFLVTDIDIKSGKSCIERWSEGWMLKSYSVTWLAAVFLPLALMTALYSRVVYTLWFKRNDANQLSHQQQGVVKVRKRVTLMVVTVTTIFGICWGTAAAQYTLRSFVSYPTGPFLVPIVNIMVLFNSAVNPFVYALLNHQFREKMKKMICCIGSSTVVIRVHPAPEPQNMEPPNNNNTQPTTT